MKNFKKVTILSLLLLSINAFSLEYVMFKGGNFVKVAEDKVQKTCGDNFAFRSKYKDQAPLFLTKALIQAAFQGKFLSGIKTISKDLKDNPGKCAWIDPSEFGKL